MPDVQSAADDLGGPELPKRRGWGRARSRK
jgi:hypothetical protein